MGGGTERGRKGISKGGREGGIEGGYYKGREGGRERGREIEGGYYKDREGGMEGITIQYNTIFLYFKGYYKGSIDGWKD